MTKNKIEDWNKALEEAMKKKFNDGVEKMYTNSSYGTIKQYKDEIKTQEKKVKVVDLTDPVIEKLKDKFDERSAVGVRKYGTTLDQNNDDDFLNHLLEELMDASAYIMKLIIEKEKK